MSGVNASSARTSSASTSHWNLLPGLLLATAIAAIAVSPKLIWPVPIINPIVIAVVLGMSVSALIGVPASAKPGLAFASKTLLRISIVLLGLQLTFGELVKVGAIAVVLCAFVLVATFLFTKWLGRFLNIDSDLAELLASGTAVCGASAVIATNTLTRASDSDVAYALGCITIFGTLSILTYPFVMTGLGLTPELYALWTGASVHEVAQVVAASSQGGPEAVILATVVKLARVLMLAPLILIISAMRHIAQPASGRTQLFPWFIVGFVLLIIIGSAFEVPSQIRQAAGTVTTFIFTIALAALGISTHFRSLTARGWRPVFVAAGAWLFVSTLALLGVLLAVQVSLIKG